MLSKIQQKKLVEIILDKTHAFDNAIILFKTNKIVQNDGGKVKIISSHNAITDTLNVD